MANNSKRSSNRAGAVLITVLTVACFAAILLTAVLTFVKRAHTNAYNNYNSEQAYYIASSALGSVHDYFEQQKDQNYPDLVTYAEANTNGTITLGNSAIGSVIPGGDCKVNISKVNDGYIRLSVTGYYNGQAETINAYYAVTPGQKPPGIDNAFYSNGTASFNQQCTNTGSVTTGSTYYTGNNSNSSGSIITGGDFIVDTKYSWSNDPNSLANSFIVAQGSLIQKNDNVSFVPTLPKKDDNISQFISLGGAYFGCNDVTIGGTSGNGMDLYCNALFVGPPNGYYANEYSSVSFPGASAILTVNGNVYCYKIEDTDSRFYGNDQDGDFIVTSGTGGVIINGDLFVEGDINIGVGNLNGGFNVNGTLYVSPTTNITSGGVKIKCDAISGDGLTFARVAQWMADGVLEINGVNTSTVVQEYNSNKTNPNLESILQMVFGTDKVRTDPINHGSASSRNYKPATKFEDNYAKTYETTPEFLANSQNSVINQKYIAANLTNMSVYKKENYHDNDLNLDVAFYIDGTHDSGGCYIDATSVGGNPNLFTEGNGKIIFVDMNQFSGDYVIRVKGMGSPRQFNMPMIIVKNGERDAQGNITTQPEGCLYIISDNDMGDNLNIYVNSLGNTGAGLMDYYTYMYVVKQNRGINIAGFGSNGSGVVELNASSGYTGPDGQDHGVYTPVQTRSFIMLNPGDKITLSNYGSGSVIEGVIYAPLAAIDAGTGYGSDKFYLLKDVNSTELKKFTLNGQDDIRMSVLGAIICEDATLHQTFGVSFVPPSTDTKLGGDGSGEDVGSVTFSHYESR